MGIWEKVIDQLPSLGGLALLAWMLHTKLLRAEKRLDKCEESREVLTKEHADIRVELAEVKAKVDGGS